jgi:branched-chain amino acid transport system substrate-binding protein
MKRPAFALAALTLLLLAPAAAPAQSSAPFELNAILPTSGAGSFLGSQEQAALGVLQTVVNRQGGINGRPVKFTFFDDQSNPVLSVQLTNGLIAKGVPVILGSSVAAMCAAMVPLVEKNGPVQFCYSPIIRGAANSFVFSSSAGTYPIASTLARFFRENGWTRIAVITSTDATGQDFDRQLDTALAQNENKPMTVLTHEHFNPADLSVSAQMARIKAVNPQGLITFTTGTALGTILRGFAESGMDLPISAGAGNMVYAQIAQYKDFLPKRLYFAATRGVAPDTNLRPGPIRDAQNRYFAAFKEAGIRPDYASSLVWDPTMIVIDGLRKLGPAASADRLRQFIVGLHSWAGIDGIYDFRDGSQKGIGEGAMVIYRWDAPANSFVVSSRPGGRLR